MNSKLDLSKLLLPQREHAVKMLNSLYMNGVAADLSETGCGKTFVASWVAKHLNVPLVIVCPKVVMREWTKVLAVFGIKAKLVINYELLMRGNTPHLTFKNGHDDVPENYQIKFPKDALVILDECHKCKGWKSKNSDFLIALKRASYKIMLLSATAATNPLEMKSFGFATLLHKLVDFRQFLKDAGAYTNRYGAYQIDVNSSRTKDAMKHMHTCLFDGVKCAGRMTRSQFKTIFPDNRVIADIFDMGSNTGKIQKVYDQMEKELAELEESSSEYSGHQFAVMTRARRLAELLKVPTIVESIEDLFEEGISPVVFVNYTDTVTAIASKLSNISKMKDKVAYIVGGQSEKSRHADIDAFQADTKRVMIANIAAGNAGVSLHDLIGDFPRHSIVSPSFSAINLIQALGRIHRANGKTPCIQKIMFAAGTIEEHACRRVQDKIQNLDMLNDGDLTSGINLV